MLFLCIRGESVSIQLKLMILVNVLLCLLFVVSDYVLWSIISGASWSFYGAVPSWSPLYVTPTYPIITGSRPFIATMSTPAPLLDIPFLLFLAMFVTNLYFIIKLERSREAKQNTT